MSVVLLFEAQVQPGRLEAYVHYALEAQRDLAAADGCLSTEQLMAVDEARRIMVKSIWRDSASAQRVEPHQRRAARRAGSSAFTL